MTDIDQDFNAILAENERLNAVCAICDHEWRRHDPEDGKCDAPGLLVNPPTCFCGREYGITAWQARNATRSRAALAPAPAPEGRYEPK